uniref:Uncharacterized protein n=1 Tax=Oryza rufipogon TaxID=4529 RepID=A0A0E0QG99_ORYRU
MTLENQGLHQQGRSQQPQQQAIKSETIEGAAAGTHREEAKRKGNTDFVMDDDGCGLPLWPWWRCKDGGGNRNNATVLAWE